MAGQPQHAAAETPVAWAAGNDQRVELVLAHFRPQRAIAAVIFGFGELLPDRVAVIRRVAHIGERQRLVELCAHDLPRLRADARRTNVHGRTSGNAECQNHFFAAPPARPRESGDLAGQCSAGRLFWIPAYAGMSGKLSSAFSRSVTGPLPRQINLPFAPRRVAAAATLRRRNTAPRRDNSRTTVQCRARRPG